MATRTAQRAKNQARDTAGRAAGTAGKAGGAAQSADPSDQLRQALQDLTGTLTTRAVKAVTGRIGSTAERLNGYASGNGSGGLLSALTGKPALKAAVGAGLTGLKEKLGSALGGGGGGKGSDDPLKVTNIVESIDVGVPVDLAYDQWTRFTEFPTFMKKVENVEQVSDERLKWKAQVFWSHRTWESTILDQVPGDRIVWRSSGEKGYVDGAVTFHELAPNLTRILLVLEYHPQGFFERTGNLWRAQGRRARLELKHFRRHVMTESLLHADEIEGWRGEIRDGEVVDTGESEDTESGESDQDTEDTDEARERESEEDTDEAGAEPEPEDTDEAEESPRPRRRGTRGGRS
ncbi:SRPBCC family protein [Prauserella muralis]|uniref:Cyclase n=1 Tax=Prauserella muralis TaxID=588067 RepID=A0A2V4AIP9_9PSEU|nr:SRPBCC family protein [Prauserella muralis]PXY19056.1 cyclase [Prauserella muralis]TWE28953.1 putative membrane protein [Prauserella muralis]